MTTPISPKQIVLIHLALRDLKIPDSQYRALLMGRYPSCWTGSSKELSFAEASDLLDHFKSLGFAIRPKARPDRKRTHWTPGARRYAADMGGAPDKLVSRAEEAKIRALAGGIKWKVKNGLYGFIDKIIGRRWPVTAREAYVCIEALKKMRDNQIVDAHIAGASILSLLDATGISEASERDRVADYIAATAFKRQNQQHHKERFHAGNRRRPAARRVG